MKIVIKTWDFFRYDIPYFLKNLWTFRKNLWNWRAWDFSYNLDMLKTGLQQLEKSINNSNEISQTRLKKVQKIQRCIQLIDIILNEMYIDLAEQELGELISRDIEIKDVECGGKKYKQLVDNLTDAEKEHNSKIFNRSIEIEQEIWLEFCQIIKGQNQSNFTKLENESDPEKIEQHWWNQFDGSGAKGWWN